MKIILKWIEKFPCIMGVAGIIWIGTGSSDCSCGVVSGGNGGGGGGGGGGGVGVGGGVDGGGDNWGKTEFP